jgi:hypothetical protein
MSRALDKLEATIKAEVAAGSAVKTMNRDQLIDEISNVMSGLTTNLSFFTGLGEECEKLHGWYVSERKNNSKLPSIAFMSKVYSHLTGKAKISMEKTFFGPMVDALASMGVMFTEITNNISKLFADKTFNLYNTKISHVAVLGMLEDARLVNRCCEAFIAVMCNDRCKELPVAPYQKKLLDDSAEQLSDILNRTVDGRQSKTFAAAITRYKSSGNDVTVLSSDNNSAVQFAKLDGDVSESTIRSGCRGLAIFRWIGDLWSDYQDAKARKAAALREEHIARVKFLQMQLMGEDPNSAEYKRLAKIIANYEVLINRLNQKLDKYYNEK